MPQPDRESHRALRPLYNGCPTEAGGHLIRVFDDARDIEDLLWEDRPCRDSCWVPVTPVSHGLLAHAEPIAESVWTERPCRISPDLQTSLSRSLEFPQKISDRHPSGPVSRSCS